jgi:copper(I)-binding protein
MQDSFAKTTTAAIGIAVGVALSNLAAGGIGVSAHETRSGASSVVHAWAKPTIGENAPIFMRFVNGGDETRVIAAESSRSARAGLMQGVGQPSDGFAIDASGELVLQPGGSHVMAIMLDGPLNDGEQMPISLTLDDGSVIDVDVAIEDSPTHQ